MSRSREESTAINTNPSNHGAAYNFVGMIFTGLAITAIFAAFGFGFDLGLIDSFGDINLSSWSDAERYGLTGGIGALAAVSGLAGASAFAQNGKNIAKNTNQTVHHSLAQNKNLEARVEKLETKNDDILHAVEELKTNSRSHGRNPMDYAMEERGSGRRGGR